MTEENQTIDDAPQEEVIADNDSQTIENAEVSEEKEAQTTDPDSIEEGDDSDETIFPKKAVNALSRKNKQINKLRARMQELEAKLKESPEAPKDQVDINPDDYDSYGEYVDARVEALVEQRLSQSQSDMQKQQITQQQDQLKAQRDQYIIEQANEVSQTLTDLPQVWSENAALLDALPEQISDIFYNIDNAPAAIYTLAKEGKLESLLYANPNVAAYEIVNAQNRGMELLAKPQPQVSQAPTPITKARGTGTVKKELGPNDDVLKSLGIKQ